MEFHCEKILVIDDDPDLVELIRLTLETKGYQVFSAATGTEVDEKYLPVDDFVEKPLKASDLLQKVEKLLGK